MFRRILVALDRTDSANAVLEAGMTIAKPPGTHLMLLHVASVFEDGYSAPFYPGIDGIYAPVEEEVLKNYFSRWNALQQESLEWLKTIADRPMSQGISTEFSQNVGDPGQVICNIAHTWEADLVVIGRRGRKGVTEALLGSVSNYVVHHADCSVLTVQGVPMSSSRTGAEKQATVA